MVLSFLRGQNYIKKTKAQNFPFFSFSFARGKHDKHGVNLALLCPLIGDAESQLSVIVLTAQSVPLIIIFRLFHFTIIFLIVPLLTMFSPDTKPNLFWPVIL